MAKLTKEEQLELERLERKFGGGAAAGPQGLTSEEEAELAELDAKFGTPKETFPEGFFAPQPTVTVPNQSLPYQVGAAVMGMGNRLGISKLAGKIGVPNVEEQTKAAKEQYAPSFNLGENVIRVAPALAIPAAGTSLGAPGLVVTTNQAIAANALAAGAERAYGDVMDVTQDISASEAAKNAATDTLVTAVGGKVLDAGANLAAKGLTKVANNLRGVGTKTMDGLKAGLKRLGFENSEIREAAKQALKKEAPNSNPLIQLKTLVDENVIAGKQSTTEIAEKFNEVLTKNTNRVNEIANDTIMGNQVLPTEKSILQLKFNPKQVAMRGGPDAYREQAVKILKKEAPGLLDNTNNIRSLTRKEAIMFKQGLQELRGDYSKRIDVDDVSKEVINAVENHIRDVIEETTPEVAKLNKVSSAILGMKPYIEKLENKGVDVAQGRLRQSLSRTLGSPFTTGAAGAGLGALVGPQVGMDSRQGALLGAGIGAGVRAGAYPKSLQDSLNTQATRQIPQALPRTLEAVGGFIQQNAGILSPPLAQMLQKIQSLPPKQQEQMLPQAITVLEQAGVPVEPPASGYLSEVNGRLTDPADIIAAGQELWQRKDLSILEKSKMLKKLNADGTVPMQVQSDESLIVRDPQGRMIKITEDGSYGF